MGPKIAATYHRASPDAEEFSDEDRALFWHVYKLEEEGAATRGPCYVDAPAAVRRAFDHMLDDANAGRFQVLAVYRAEYLCRTARELEALRTKLEALGVELLVIMPAPVQAPVSRIGRPAREFDVIHARRLKQKGWTFAAIAKELRVGVATVHRALKQKPRPQLRA